MAETKPAKTRKPRASKKLNYDQVLQYAYALTLKERAELSKEVKTSVSKELVELEASTREVSSIISEK